MSNGPTIFLSRVKTHNGRRLLVVRSGRYKTLRDGRMVTEYYGGFVSNLVTLISYKEVQ